MTWYRAGTVTVANGSASIAGVDTDFVSNVTAGAAFRGPDGRGYEIARVVSATELTLAEGYAGGSGGGQPYAIQPTQSFARDLALSAAALLGTFAAVRDGIGQGLIADGSASAPGIRFAADQDTGIRRFAHDGFSLVAGGADRLTVTPVGITAYGSAEIVRDQFPAYAISRQGVGTWFVGGSGVAGDNGFVIRLNGDEAAIRIDVGQNLLVGAPAALLGAHTIAKAVPAGAAVAGFYSPTTNRRSGIMYAVSNDAWSSAGCALGVGQSGATGRSINAAGTVNASGADYAEYMTKSADCGMIAAGDVCGVDRDGRLTRTWADAESFVVKSTAPSYVGGDTWAAHLPPPPEPPAAAPSEPVAPDGPLDDEAAQAEWREALSRYPAQVAQWKSDHAAWMAACAAYDRDRAAWDAALEAARVTVDRIAFCGQVPVNVTGDFAVGDYLIAAPAGAGIKAVAIAAAEITFEQYRRRLGKVWAVRDGRAWIDVQHG